MSSKLEVDYADWAEIWQKDTPTVSGRHARVSS